MSLNIEDLNGNSEDKISVLMSILDQIAEEQGGMIVLDVSGRISRGQLMFQTDGQLLTIQRVVSSIN